MRMGGGGGGRNKGEKRSGVWKERKKGGRGEKDEGRKSMFYCIFDC